MDRRDQRPPGRWWLRLIVMVAMVGIVFWVCNSLWGEFRGLGLDWRRIAMMAAFGGLGGFLGVLIDRTIDSTLAAKTEDSADK